MIVAALTAHHPDWFSPTGAMLRNHLTGECLGPAARSIRWTLPGAWCRKICVLSRTSADGPVFTAASLCFPSRWRLLDKIGSRCRAVHGPVPLYADRLAKPVDRFMRHVKPGHIASRLNWSLLDDPALFQPGGKWRDAGQHRHYGRITPAAGFSCGWNARPCGRLPMTQAVLFGIRVHVYPLDQVIDSRTRALFWPVRSGTARRNPALQEPAAVQAAALDGCRRGLVKRPQAGIGSVRVTSPNCCIAAPERGIPRGRRASRHARASSP